MPSFRPHSSIQHQHCRMVSSVQHLARIKASWSAAALDLQVKGPSTPGNNRGTYQDVRPPVLSLWKEVQGVERGRGFERRVDRHMEYSSRGVEWPKLCSSKPLGIWRGEDKPKFPVPIGTQYNNW